MKPTIELYPYIDGKLHLSDVTWTFANPDAAELAYRQAIDAINRVYLMPGNADSTNQEQST